MLRDGTTTEDVRLDRLIEFDTRSRSYGIAAVVESKPLRSYTWSCGEWFDQGRQGACVAYSLSHELVARPAVVKGITDPWIRELYYQVQRDDPWPGGEYPGADPVYGGTSVLSGLKALQSQGFCGSYRWAFGLQDVLLGVGYSGPACLGINWFEGMFDVDSEGYVRVTGSAVGGHAIIVRSVNLPAKRVTLRNSWGRDWGRDGDCYMSFDDLEKLLYMQGEAAFLVDRVAKTI